MSDQEHEVISKLKELNLIVYNEEVGDDQIFFSLDIWAKPGAKVEKTKLGPQGELIIFIKERPIDGAANKGLTRRLSDLFGTACSEIELRGGSKSKFKRFSIRLTFTNHKDINYYLKKMDKIFCK